MKNDIARQSTPVGDEIDEGSTFRTTVVVKFATHGKSGMPATRGGNMPKIPNEIDEIAHTPHPLARKEATCRRMQLHHHRCVAPRHPPAR